MAMRRLGLTIGGAADFMQVVLPKGTFLSDCSRAK